MGRLRYLLENTTEPDIRFRDAMLFVALHRHLGSVLEALPCEHRPTTGDVLWGRDAFQEDSRRAARLQSAYRNPAVQLALGGAKECAVAEVPRALSFLREAGYGAVLRNLRAPNDNLRYTEPADRFEQHAHAISIRPGDSILVQPYFKGGWMRRFLVVGGEIICDTPVSYCEFAPGHISPLLIPPEDIGQWNARDPFLPISRGSPFAESRDMQIMAAHDLLADFEMMSGAIDVSLVKGPAGWSACVTEITTAPPGGFDTYWAPLGVYAERVAAALHLIEPDLAADAADLSFG